MEVTHECFIAYFVLITVEIPEDDHASAIVPLIVGLRRDGESRGWRPKRNRWKVM